MGNHQKCVAALLGFLRAGEDALRRNVAFFFAFPVIWAWYAEPGRKPA